MPKGRTPKQLATMRKIKPTDPDENFERFNATRNPNNHTPKTVKEAKKVRSVVKQNKFVKGAAGVSDVLTGGAVSRAEQRRLAAKKKKKK